MNAVLSPFAGYILYDATWSGTAPLSTYLLSDFQYRNPAKRVKWNVKTATITATLAGGMRLAEIFALPMSNIDAGATVLSLTNGAGLNVAIPVPVVPTGPYGRLPFTTICDLRKLAGAAARTSNVWNMVVTANSVNLTLGGAIWLGTALDFTANFRPGPIVGSQFYNGADANFFGTVNRVRSRCRTRSFDFGVPTRDAQRDALVEAIESGEGAGLPAVLWPNPAVNDGLYGSFADTVANAWMVKNFSPMDGLRFTEWSKGPPLL